MSSKDPYAKGLVVLLEGGGTFKKWSLVEES
jgi:hypothetical protein